MKITLTSEAEASLKIQHKKERNRINADRIKAVLLSHKGWKQVDIAEALFINEETVKAYLKDYADKNKLSDDRGGYGGKLNEHQVKELIQALEEATYSTTKEICEHIKLKYQVLFTPSGITKWLHSHGFSYKRPKATPAKADPEKQAQFIEAYEQLKISTPDNEPIVFGDAVHPTMATKITSGWIRTGKDKLIATTASRTRMNMVGCIDLTEMALHIHVADTINSDAMEVHFQKLREAYPDAPWIHYILDNGPYNVSDQTKKAAEKYRIKLYYLPPYSPNLNPIERVWKIMNEKVRNNVYFPSPTIFRQAVLAFFETTWPNTAYQFIDRVNDTFCILQKPGI